MDINSAQAASVRFTSQGISPPNGRNIGRDAGAFKKALNGDSERLQRLDETANQIRWNPELAEYLAKQSFVDFAVQFSRNTSLWNTAPTAYSLIDYVDIASRNPDLKDNMINTIMSEYGSKLNKHELQSVIDAFSIQDPVKKEGALIEEANIIRMRRYPSRVTGLAELAVSSVKDGYPGLLPYLASVALKNPDLRESIAREFVSAATKEGLDPQVIQNLLVASSHENPATRDSEIKRVTDEIGRTRNH